MKKIIFLLLIVVLAGAQPARSQTIDQLVVQLALDIEKLAEMKSILSDLYKAYTIVDKGYSDIHDIVSGNFNLHKAFLDALLTVSPTVQNYVHVADIISAEYSIVSEYKTAYGKLKSGGRFTAQELSYISNFYNAILSRGADCIERLTMVLTANQLRMNDAERLNEIDAIYNEITGNLSRLRTFNGQNAVQDLQRAKEGSDIGQYRGMNGVPFP